MTVERKYRKKRMDLIEMLGDPWKAAPPNTEHAI